MSEKRDLWVPAVLVLGGVTLSAWNAIEGRGLLAALAVLLALTAAIACLPLRLKQGQARLVAFGLGAALFLVPLAPPLAGPVAQVLPWFVAGLGFLVPLRALTPPLRRAYLVAAGVLAVLGLLAFAGAVPAVLTWLFLSGAFFFAVQVFYSRPRRKRAPPPGRRVCIMGGSFDPFHRGHRTLARAALKTVDRLLVVPAGNAPHKNDEGVTPFHHRLAMARLGVEGLSRVEVLELEGRRPGASFTIDTLDVVRRSFPEGTQFLLLVGADMYQDLPTWRAWERLVGETILLVAARPGWDLDPPPEMEGLAVRTERLEAPLVDVAARDLRADLAAGRPVGDRIPPNVVAYLREHGLYGTGTGAHEAS